MPEPNLLVVARELERGLFQCSFPKLLTGKTQRYSVNHKNLRQSAAWEKEIEKEFRNNPRYIAFTLPLKNWALDVLPHL
jgi:hypothetical protein